MPEFPKERRQQRPFRILYMPLDDFLRRFVLRGKNDPVVSSPKTRLALASAPTPEKATPWKCGVTRLDEGNQVLFKAIRQFQGALKGGAEPGAMDAAVTFLKEHTDGHLALEEAYMEHIHFPGLTEHRQVHQVFQTQVRAFHHQLSEGDPGAGMELSRLLYAWIRVHVVKEDAVWSEFAKANRHCGNAPAPE